MDFAIHVGFAHAPRDQLRVLAAEIKNEDHCILKYTGRRTAYEIP